jgi:hypothetical protein
VAGEVLLPESGIGGFASRTLVLAAIAAMLVPEVLRLRRGLEPPAPVVLDRSLS